MQEFKGDKGGKSVKVLRTIESKASGACAQDEEVGVMYIPRPSYTASGNGNALSPSVIAQRNQTAERFSRAQDTYVIAVAVSCACAGMVLLAVGGIAATIEMRKYDLRATQADQSEGQRPAGSGRRVDDLAASPVEQELYIPVMVVQPDDTVTIACKLAACPKQTEVQVQAQMAPQWQEGERAHSADAQTVRELSAAGSSPA